MKRVALLSLLALFAVVLFVIGCFVNGIADLYYAGKRFLWRLSGADIY